jgi:hypothetical protein
LTQAVSRLQAEKERLQQTIQLLVHGEMGAPSSIGVGGVPLCPLDTASPLLGGGGLLAPRFPMQQLGQAAGASSSLQQGTNSMLFLASLGGASGGGYQDSRGQGLAAAFAGPSAAMMPANPYLEAIQGLGDSSLRPYLASLPRAQSQSDSQRAAILSALLGNTSTTTTQSTGRNINPTEAAALELLLSRQQRQGGNSNDESESSKNKPTR